MAFAIAHFSPEQFIPLTVLGVCLGAVHIIAGYNLAAPIVAHGLYNAVVLVFYSLSNGGLPK